MTSFVHVDYSLQHPGVARAERTFEFFHPVLHALAAIGAPVVRLGGVFAAWRQARREARSDARMWEMACQDARLMADISRAMDQEARDYCRN